MKAFERALRECLPSDDEALTMAAEGLFPPPSFLDPPELHQAIWDGVATLKALLESTPIDEWPHFDEEAID